MANKIKMDDDRVDRGVPLRERYELFCGHFVACRNPMQAFRLAFVPDKSKTSQFIHEAAQQLLADVDIAARVQAMRDDAAAQTIVSVRELMQDWHDIAVADPNEIVSHVRECCRFCHGLGHRFQWVDDNEYAQACDKAIRTAPPDKPAQLPDFAGGVGYRPDNEPVITCPACFGRGEGRTIIHDTTKLSGAARKLYAGVKETRAGVEVLMHDQQKARESLARVLGAFKDGAVVPAPSVPAAAAAAAVAKSEDPAKSYLRLVSGGA